MGSWASSSRRPESSRRSSSSTYSRLVACDAQPVLERSELCVQLFRQVVAEPRQVLVLRGQLLLDELFVDRQELLQLLCRHVDVVDVDLTLRGNQADRR